MRTLLGWTACVAGCAAVPLFVPQAWVHHGAFPDLAVLCVLYLAVSGTPQRAAVLGVAIGLLRSAWTAEPLGLDAALYGTLGWSGAHFGRAVFQERASVQMAASAAGVLALRSAGAMMAALTALTPAAAQGTHGMSPWTWIAAAAWSALATALAAPVAFALLSWSRILGGLERRRVRDV